MAIDVIESMDCEAAHLEHAGPVSDGIPIHL